MIIIMGFFLYIGFYGRLEYIFISLRRAILVLSSRLPRLMLKINSNQRSLFNLKLLVKEILLIDEKIVTTLID